MDKSLIWKLIADIKDDKIVNKLSIEHIHCGNCAYRVTICRPAKGEVQSISLHCSIRAVTRKYPVDTNCFCAAFKAGEGKVEHKPFEIQAKKN